MTAAQNSEGGIGGGHGHQSHIAPSYAAILALAIMGDAALDCIDRKAMFVHSHSLFIISSPLCLVSDAVKNAGGSGLGSSSRVVEVSPSARVQREMSGQCSKHEKGTAKYVELTLTA